LAHLFYYEILVCKLVFFGCERDSSVQLEQKIEKIIEPAVSNLGFEIVRVQVSGNERPTLQIMAEPAFGNVMTVEHCAMISRAVAAILDIDDPIQGNYILEVSSPGIDRPLIKVKDFERFTGFEARIETSELIDGRKRFRGRLSVIQGGSVTISNDGMDWTIPFPSIRRAKLLAQEDQLVDLNNQ